MAKFCTKCGRPLVEGQQCVCSAPTQSEVNNQTGSSVSIGELWKKFKNQIGLGDPLTNERSAYENGMRIVPDCVKPNDSEIPVKQYKIATLRNRILGIPYTKAIGRMQITNKRIIFRAPGRCLVGRTTLQHEFAIDEIAGIESRREYVFNIWDLLGGLICFALGGAIGNALALALSDNGRETFLAFFISFLLACGAGALFSLVKKKWAVKLLGLGAATVPLMAFGMLYSQMNEEFLGGLMTFIGIILLVLSIFTLFIHAISPNLALIVKTKAASEAMDIRRKKLSLFGGAQNDKADHTGYTEILPEADAELSIREIGAVINDIQKLGDFGVEKWKV